ncbi:Bug family tripartite tricarboxylate transporter substrate binding protein [Pollutimonas sp. M17]|uniref:Bug family tripartite tricarboxylate transporter substrate binding protein n=1 Tax=Pollutimonas sp. M17 TaxID=2962065 RepID=UPI0021F4B37F|nr:tripartite tricarboxylate transporter substrate binding protein [Pollutimonas sp. M17]UYO94206.1 tripartite tricarboxylate transporter substrate binding protein [Pollutimonas sp. M17]
MKKILSTALMAASLCLTGIAAAQSYPNQPIRMIIPFAAGGTTDFVGRVIGEKLGEILGQPIVIESRGGAGTIIGTGVLARAPSDGYTIMLATPDFTINPSLQPELPYETPKDFTPISLIATYPLVLAANSEQGIKSVSDLISRARAKPGQLNYASAGNGSIQHLCGAMLVDMAKLEMTHVPYKGGAPAAADLVAGRVSVLCSGAPPLDPYVKSGKLRILAVSTPTSHPALPGVPSIAESGVPGFDVTAWFGFIGPADLPKDVVKRLNDAIVKVMQDPDLRKRLSILGADLAGSTPEAMGSLINAEIEKWRRVIIANGIKAQ